MIQKVARRSSVRGWVSPSDDWKTLSLSTGSKWIHFSNQGRIKQRRMGSAFHQLCPRYSGTQSPLPLRLRGYGKPSPLPVISNTNNSILIFYHNYEMKTEGWVATFREWLAPPLLLLVVFFPARKTKIFIVKFTSRNGYIVEFHATSLPPPLSPSAPSTPRSPTPLSRKYDCKANFPCRTATMRAILRSGFLRHCWVSHDNNE